MGIFSGRRKAAKRSDGQGPTDGGGDPSWAQGKLDAQDTAAVRGSTRNPSAAKGIQGTAERLVALQTAEAGFRELITDALDAILEGLHVTRGAILVFDTFDQTLVLAAERGLGAEAKKLLARIRRDDEACWDMPLHGLLNERAYLIDEPAKNRYVPALVESGNQSLARIACMPVLQQRKPVGSIILIGGRGERLGETEIRLSQTWLRYLANIIDDLREREGVSALFDAEAEDEDTARRRPLFTRKAVKIKQMVAPLFGAGTTPSAPPADPGGSTSILLTDMVDDRESPAPMATPPGAASPDTIPPGYRARPLPAGPEVARTHMPASETAAAGTAQQPAAWEQEKHAAMAALREGLQAEHKVALAAVEAERDRYADTVASLTASVASARAERQERAADAGRIAELKSALERSQQAAEENARRLTETEQEVRSRDLRIEKIESDRQRLAAEADAARQQLGGALQRAEGAETMLKTRAAEIAALRQTVSEAEAQSEAARDLKASLAALEAERNAAFAALDEARQHVRNLEEAVDSDGSGTSALVAELNAAQGKEDTKRRAITELTATVARLEATRTELEGCLESARAKEEANARTIADLTTTVERLQDARAELTARLNAGHGKGESSGRTLSELTAIVERLEGEKGLVAERCEHLEGQLGRLQETMAAQEQAARGARAELEAAAAARERDLRDTLTRTVADGAAREAALEREAERLRHEGEALADRLAGTEGRLRESAAALDAHMAAEEKAVAEVARLQAAEAAARAAADEWCEKAEALGKQVSALEQAVETARAEVAGVGEHANAVERESKQWQGEAEKLTIKVADLEQMAQAAAARAAELAERAQAAEGEAEQWQTKVGELSGRVGILEEERKGARGERDRWREEADSARSRILQLSEAMSVVQAEAARTANREDAARAEAARLEAEVERLSAQLADMAERHGAREDEGAELRQALRELEGRAAEHNAVRAELEAAVARLEEDRAAAQEDAERAGAEAAAANARLEASRSEAPVTDGKVAELTAAVEPDADGETPQRAAVKEEEVGARPPRPTGAAVSAEDERFVLLEPAAAIGKAIVQSLGARARVIVPEENIDDVVREVREARGTVAGVNLGLRGAPNGFLLARQLLEAIPGLRVWAYAAPPNASKGISLGFVEWLAQPVHRDQLVRVLARLGGRGTRALSVGLDMKLLLAVRKLLSQQGISLSMACDSKQGQELRGMVNPQTLVIDLDLPRNDGFRALGRLSGNHGALATWLLCGGATPPAEAGSVVVSGAMERSAASFVELSDLGKAWLRECTRGAGPPEGEGLGKVRRSPRSAALGGRGRTNPSGGGRTTPGGRRGNGPAHRRSTIL